MSNEAILNLAAFLKGTRMAGPGVRDVLWVQGCSIKCPGCANREYLPHVPRVLMPVGKLLSHFRVRKHKIDGCTVLGGEPTEQADAVAVLLRGAREMGLSTVVFTGRTREELESDCRFRDLLAFTDLLIDGPYVEALADPDLHWRGSSNQRLHRLSGRFSEKDIIPAGPNGEVLLTKNGPVLHGIGTGRIIPG